MPLRSPATVSLPRLFLCCDSSSGPGSNSQAGQLLGGEAGHVRLVVVSGGSTPGQLESRKPSNSLEVQFAMAIKRLFTRRAKVQVARPAYHGGHLPIAIAIAVGLVAATPCTPGLSLNSASHSESVLLAMANITNNDSRLSSGNGWRSQPLEDVYRYSLRAIWALVGRVTGRGDGPSDEGLQTEQRQQNSTEQPPSSSVFLVTGGNRDYAGPNNELEVLFGDEIDDEAWIVVQWAK